MKPRPPIGGIAVVILAVLTLAVVVVAQPSCDRGNSTPWGAPGPQPMELNGDWLGLTLTSTSSVAAQQLGIPAGTSGVVVTKVNPAASPAAAVGVSVGDLIVGVDGNAVVSLSNLYTMTTELGAGRPLPIDIMRRGQPMTVVVQPPGVAMAPAVAPTGAMQAGMGVPGFGAMPPAPTMPMPMPVPAQAATCPTCGATMMR